MKATKMKLYTEETTEHHIFKARLRVIEMDYLIIQSEEDGAPAP